jgi:hypothetical protein
VPTAADLDILRQGALLYLLIHARITSFISAVTRQSGVGRESDQRSEPGGYLAVLS